MRVVDFFNERRSNGQPLVLVSVFETAGSTFSKAGAQMLIDGEGHYCGMLSGGCLESDLGDVAATLQGRLRGPAGIDLGGRGPGPIALAIVAEMQQFLNQRV